MKIISHRGNLTGPDPKQENKPSQILKVLEKGYEVEVDVWYAVSYTHLTLPTKA